MHSPRSDADRNSPRPDLHAPAPDRIASVRRRMEAGELDTERAWREAADAVLRSELRL